MDFKQLSRVADTLDGKYPSTVSGQGLEVEESKNPLDALEIKSRVQDTAKTKVLILDAKKIQSVLDGPREERRKFLAKLTDSQRRRVLQVYQDTKKIKDEEQPAKKLDYVLLDSSLANYIFTPNDYNKSILLEALESKQFDDDVVSLVNSIINDEFDVNDETHKAQLDAFYERLAEEDIVPDTEKALEVMSVADSVRIIDSDISSEVMGEIATQVTSDLESWNGEDISDLNEVAEESISNFVKKGYDYGKVSEAYWDVMNVEYGKKSNQAIEDHVQKTFGMSIKDILDKKIIDEAVEEALNEIHENDYIDESGNAVKPVEDTPILTLLNEALSAFAEGDASKLEELATQTISNEQSEDAEDLDEGVEEESAEDLDDEGVEESEVEELDDLAPEGDIELKDSVKIANAILKGKNINKVIDTLASRVEAFRKYYFKVADCGMCCEVAAATSPIEVPMTCEEYNAIVPKTNECFEHLLGTLEIPQCPYVQDIWPSDDNLFIRVNTAQSYVPVGCTPQEFCKDLELIPREQWAQHITEHCKPLTEVLQLAAVTNNLNIVDNKFYKKHLRDSFWSFDQCPKILESTGKTSGRVSICKDSNRTEGVVEIFGQKYIIE